MLNRAGRKTRVHHRRVRHPPFLFGFFLSVPGLIKVKAHHFTILDAKGRIFLIRHFAEIGSHHSGDPIMRDNDKIAAIGLQLIQKIIDPLRQMKHGFTAFIGADELALCRLKVSTVTRHGFVFPEVLLDQTRFFDCMDAGDFSNVQRGILRPDKRRITDLIRLDPHLQDLSPCFYRLFMTKFSQGDVRSSADLVLHIPDRLSVADIVQISHLSHTSAHPPGILILVCELVQFSTQNTNNL